jgi:hypothetical protein
MNWLSRFRRAIAARRRPPTLPDGPDDAQRGAGPGRPSRYDSTFGYGALVIGTSQASSRHTR